MAAFENQFWQVTVSLSALSFSFLSLVFPLWFKLFICGLLLDLRLVTFVAFLHAFSCLLRTPERAFAVFTASKVSIKLLQDLMVVVLAELANE